MLDKTGFWSRRAANRFKTGTVPVSKPRKKKSSRPAARSGNPAVRRAELERAQQEKAANSSWREPANPFGEYRRQLDRQRMKLAARDAEPIIADLVAEDRSLSCLEDELCRHLGSALARQDAAIDARRESGVTEILDAYSPDQLLDAITDATVLAAHKSAQTSDEPEHRDGTWRMLLSLARVVPHPSAEIPIKAVTDLRKSVGPRSQAAAGSHC